MNEIPLINLIKMFARVFLSRFRNLLRFKEMWLWETEVCGRCGSCYKLVTYWTDEKWLEVTGQEEGCFCFDCFATMAQEKHMKLSYDDIQRMWYADFVYDDSSCFDIKK